MYLAYGRHSRGVTVSEKLKRRQCLDRRRLEEAFLLYAVLKMHFVYDLELNDVEYDKNLLVEKVVDKLLEKFLEKWSGKFSIVLAYATVTSKAAYIQYCHYIFKHILYF